MAKEPCPKCGSKDNLHRYPKGDAFCFGYGCGHYEPPPTNDNTDASPSRDEFTSFKSSEFIIGRFEAIPNRLISQKTCELYNYRVARVWDKDTLKFVGCHVANHYDERGVLTGQKLRLPGKKFSWLGKSKSLFGQHVWRNKRSAKVVITEGELDCLCLSSIQNNAYPTLSLPNGASAAVKDLKPHVKWLEDNFDEIILMFDMDDVGQAAAKEASLLFNAGKCKIATFTEKDVCDMARADKVQELIQSIHRAKAYKPEAIVNGKDTWDLIKDGIPIADALYPYEELNQLTKGIRKGEVVVITAGTSVGKSQFCREIAYNIVKQGKKIGYFALEEILQMSIRGFMSLECNRPLHLEEKTMPENELKTLHETVYKSDQIIFYNAAFQDSDLEELYKNIRYTARVGGAEFIILDHLSILVSNSSIINERLALDKINHTLKCLAIELNVGIFLVSHLSRGGSGSTAHEEGGRVSLNQLRGTQATAQLANIIIGLERNLQADNPEDTLVTQIRILKNRFTSKTGVAGFVKYDEKTGRMNSFKQDPSTVFAPDPLIKELYEHDYGAINSFV